MRTGVTLVIFGYRYAWCLVKLCAVQTKSSFLCLAGMCIGTPRLCSGPTICYQGGGMLLYAIHVLCGEYFSPAVYSRTISRTLKLKKYIFFCAALIGKTMCSSVGYVPAGYRPKIEISPPPVSFLPLSWHLVIRLLSEDPLSF